MNYTILPKVYRCYSASSDFLRLVETNKIKGVITPHIMDEVLFKILVSEASQHIEKFNIPNLME